jgi:hypothetical protein
MPSDESEDSLKGLTLKVYRLLLRENAPISIRAVQRKLDLSSSSLAAYHLSKLEDVGLVRQTPNGYVVEKVILGDLVRLRRLFVPRFFFYAALFLFVLVVELTFYRPTQITGEYVFHLTVTSWATVLFSYESFRTWRKAKLA